MRRWLRTALTTLLVLVGGYQTQAAATTVSYDLPWEVTASTTNEVSVRAGGSLGVRAVMGRPTDEATVAFPGHVDVTYSNVVVRTSAYPLALGFGGRNGDGRLAAKHDVGLYLSLQNFFGFTDELLLTTVRVDIPATPFAPRLEAIASASSSTLPLPDIDLVRFPWGFKGSIDFDLQLNDQWWPTDIIGNVVYTHRATGEKRSAAFTIDGASQTGSVNLRLDELGIWDVQIEDVGLSNRFLSDFVLGVTPQIQWGAGQICINGVCIDLDLDVWEAARFPVSLGLDWSTTFPVPPDPSPLPYGLTFDYYSFPDRAFSITVMPEPEFVLLLCAGCIGLVPVTRRLRPGA